MFHVVTLTSCCSYLIGSLVQDGRTPLCRAALNGHDVIVAILLEHMANPDVADKVRDTDCDIMKTFIELQNQRKHFHILYGQFSYLVVEMTRKLLSVRFRSSACLSVSTFE